MKEKQQQTMYEAASIRDYDELIQLWETLYAALIIPDGR